MQENEIHNNSIPSELKTSEKTISTETKQIILLVIITLFCMMPFIDKAVHIDDPLFIWAAKNIQSHPLDPYNFLVNWGGTSIPMYQETKNPPLASYYMALTAFVTGWSESSLHLAFLIPVIGFVLGTYSLAKQFCSRPFEATLAAWLTPVVLVSSTTLMCDVMMLCFWVWAMALWIQGIREQKILLLVISSIFIALSTLTKYFGINLILLMFIWTIIERRRLESSLLILFIPIIILAGYYWGTLILYGKGLISDAANYALNIGAMGSKNYLTSLFTGNVFMGGCLITILFYTNQLWKKRFLIIQIIIGIIVFAMLIIVRSLDHTVWVDDKGIRWDYILQLTLFTLTGINVIALAITDLLKHKDSTSILLFLWVIGTFLFASLINWTINGRTLLPIAPAIGILIIRRIETFPDRIPLMASTRKFLPLIIGAIIAMLVTYADYRLANTIRDDAGNISKKYRSANSDIWFEGHWGFQYYMESNGGKPIDIKTTEVRQGDIIVVPKSNTAIFPLPKIHAPIVDSLATYPLTWLSTMNTRGRAGFYSDIWGPIPYYFGTAPPERYLIRLVKTGLKFH